LILDLKIYPIKDSYNIQHYIKLMKCNIVNKIKWNRWGLIGIIVGPEFKKYSIKDSYNIQHYIKLKKCNILNEMRTE